MLSSLSLNKHRAIIRNAKSVYLEQRKTPVIKKGELLLAPLVSGLCGTDIQILRGERDDSAVVNGHEGVAQIVEAGSDCPAYFVPGAKVLINPTHPCNSAFLFGHNVDGFFQEYVRIPASAVSAGLVIPVKTKLSLKLFSLVEPLAAVLYALQLLHPQRCKDAMIIYGDGIIGHLALLLMKRRFGINFPIIFVHHRQEGLEWSLQRKMPADFDLLFDQLHLVNNILPDICSALLATPRLSTMSCLSHAVEHIVPNGCIDILGGLPKKAILPDLPTIDLISLRAKNCGGFPLDGVFTQALSIKNKPLVLCGHRGVSNNHLLEAMEELSMYGDIYAPIITHILSLEEASKFMNRLLQKFPRQINGERVMKLAIARSH
ncbi:MAG: hypothetical protein A3C55_03920 [Gammaproteobacteria bacterium RIFCSPHIGHO2_02_FULL_42_13]|nr:MAG: hypothetical protein A3C55_03920 [Gammaproteobacteria bacterium RIFCSPHIGHO2_02_FULL_42_13]OGT67930.1 MAG: hypothetical protein A3H43_02400 [Gammaproteobacteria bacterium RIFCSPLOWO2_02_FULL_42_9]